MTRIFLTVAALNGFISVAVGAFAAHALKNKLPVPLLDAVKTGAQYQMYHALALIGLACLLAQTQYRYKPADSPNKPANQVLIASGWAFILGTVLFSGSLYALAIGAPSWLGPVTPLGGLCFFVGWALLALGGLRLKAQP